MYDKGARGHLAGLAAFKLLAKSRNFMRLQGLEIEQAPHIHQMW